MFGLLNFWRVHKYIQMLRSGNPPAPLVSGGEESFHFHAIVFYLTIIMKQANPNLHFIPLRKYSNLYNYSCDNVYMIAHLNSDYYWPRINTMLLTGRVPRKFLDSSQIEENEAAFFSNTWTDASSDNDYRLLEKIYKRIDIPKHSLYTSNFVSNWEAVLIVMPRKPFNIKKVTLDQADI